MHPGMTGSWLIVKWAVMAVFAAYALLVVVTNRRLYGSFWRIRFGYMPVVLGNFVTLSVPGIFENAIATRLCFIVAGIVYILGIVTVFRKLSGQAQGSLLRTGN